MANILRRFLGGDDEESESDRETERQTYHLKETEYRVIDGNSSSSDSFSRGESENEWALRCENQDCDKCEIPAIKLPCCPHEVIDGNVRKLANKQDKPVAMSWCIGPSLEKHVFECFLLFFVKIVLLVLGLVRASLVRRSPEAPIIHWLLGLMTLIWVLLVFKHLNAEYNCFKYTTIPYVQVIGFFQILGRPVGCTFYSIYGFTFTTLQLVGLFTNTLFTANNLWLPFPESQDIPLHWNGDPARSGNFSEAQAWCITLHDSVVPEFARSHWKDMCVALAWVLTALPEIYSLLRYWPKPGEPELLRQVQPKGKDGFEGGAVDNYKLLIGGSTSTGAAAYDLAEGTGMGTIRLQTPSYPMFKAESIFKKIEESDEPDPKGVTRALYHIVGVIPRAIRRIVLESIAKSVGQANVQITLFAMHRLHMNGHWKGMALTSIIVNLIPAFQSVGFGCQVIGVTVKSICRSRALIEQMDEDEEDTRKVKEVLWQLQRMGAQLCLIFAFLLAMIFYVLAKLTGAMHSCPYYLWNTKPPYCVDLAGEFDQLSNCTLG